jgi:hypothetical protein
MFRRYCTKDVIATAYLTALIYNIIALLIALGGQAPSIFNLGARTFFQVFLKLNKQNTF